MATLIASSNHNFTAASWNTSDATALNVSNAASTGITASYVTSSTFTPGAITIDGIAVWINTRAGSSGTMSVALDQATVTVPGTEVTINILDIPASGNCWVLFKFSAPVLLSAATAYGVKIKASGISLVNCFSLATTNWARQLRTTATAAPGASDNLYVIGEKTGAGTGNTITVTMNNADAGATTFGVVDVSSGGALTWGISAATNYYLKLAGNCNIRSGGSMTIGTTGGRVPSDSTADLKFANSVNVDFGLEILGSGTLTAAGNHNAVPWALLNADASATATSLTTDRTTGWLNGDVIGIASTTRTASQSESKALTANASGTTLTITAITNDHGGSAATLVQAELINLSRNVRISGTSTTLQSYLRCDTPSVVTLDDVQFFNMGSSTTNKRGININTTTGSFTARYCAIHDFVVTSSIGMLAGTNADNITVEHCVFYGCTNDNVNFNSALSTTNITFTDCVSLKSGNIGFNIGLNVIANDLRAAGNTAQGMLLQTSSVESSMSGLVCHSNTADGLVIGGGTTLTSAGLISNILSYRNSSSGIGPGAASQISPGQLILDTMTVFGNLNSNLRLSASNNGASNWELRNGDIRAGTVLTCPIGFAIGATSQIYINFRLVNMVFGGSGQTHATTDIQVSNTGPATTVYLDNVTLNSATQVSSPSNIGLLLPSFIRANFLGQTQNHKTWFGNGTWSYDTAIADASPSLRMTPTSATVKLPSSSFFASVPSGQAATVSIKVRKSVIGDGAAYNGNQPRLMVRRNYGAGITSDTVLDTATPAGDGAFETLTGTTAAVSGNCALEFFVDCDGTAGWINVDTFTASTA